MVRFEHAEYLFMLFILNDCLFSFMFCSFVNERSKLLQESVFHSQLIFQNRHSHHTTLQNGDGFSHC